MGYAVLHMEKAGGSDSGMSAHIERTIAPKNADANRTHLNREMITFPDGVTNRTEAIQHRLETAGLQRKIGKNQVRAVRILLTGSPDDMKRIEQAGKLDDWCKDNLDWLKKTYGAENIVSAVLHLDETTPHMHATMIPIVTGERRKAKAEQATGKKKYRKKSTDATRLCADDVMSRVRLKEYQNTYAEQMAKYGLQRGIDGSEAKHVTTSQYYRDLLTQSESVQENITQLLEQKEQAEQELSSVKSDIKKEKLKGAATTAATNIAESVGSFFGSNKVKTLEEENKTLHCEVATHEETIESLQVKIQTMQTDHSRQVLEIQQQHRKDMEQKSTEHNNEISGLKRLVEKLCIWFPLAKEILRMENLCRIIGFDERQTATLVSGKPLEYEGELYSEEHKRKFTTEKAGFQVVKDPTDRTKLILAINKKPIAEWFREQFDRLKQNIRQSIRPLQRKSKELKF